MPGDFDESQHPRATDGKFSSTPGAPGSSTPPVAPPSKERTPRAAKAARGVRSKAGAATKVKIPKGAKFDAKPHERAIAKTRAQEAKFRTQSIAIKAKMAALKKEARAKAKTPAQKARYKARFDKLDEKRKELQGRADLARSARAAARKDMAAARKAHATARKTARETAKSERGAAQESKKTAAQKKAGVSEYRSLLGKSPGGGPSRNAPPVPKVVNAAPMADHEFDSFKKAHLAGYKDGQFGAEMTYSGADYKPINTALRAGQTPAGYEETIKHLDASIARAKLAKDTTLYRGAQSYGGNVGFNHYSKMNVGDVYEDKAYTSTSADPNSKVMNERVAIVISAPAGSNGAPIASKYSSEREILLPRGSKFRVDKRDVVEKDEIKSKWNQAASKWEESPIKVPYLTLHVTLVQ